MPLNKAHIIAREEKSSANPELEYSYWKSFDGWLVGYGKLVIKG